MSAIERIKSHYEQFGVQSMEVPEWGEDGKPLVIYWKPITLAEQQRLATAGERDGYIARLADALILKALDAEGKKMFTLEDKFALRHCADPHVLARVVMRMMASPGAEEMEKNSSATPASA